MYLETNQLNAIEKLFDKILLKIYPMINNIDIERPFMDGNDKYIMNFHTSLPETVTKKNYWESNHWFNEYGDGILFDYAYMNDVIIPKLLKYFNLTDRGFNREIRIYNINGDLILSTEQ